MKWLFAKNDGGRDSGFHDAGVETFKGNFDRYLARELIQNSLDAVHDTNKPVHVKFDLRELKRDEIPDIKGLKVAFERCAEYWVHQPKSKSFFERAADLAGAKTVTTLIVGDYNTTGVVGSDRDRKQNWYNLIRCAGSSSKIAGDEGGSFGIGKNAPFAASRMRTVLYSTYNKDREHVFQGVAMLASHRLPGGSTAQPTGYLGGKNGESLRTKSEIPGRFFRSKMGTDIFVLGFPAERTWQKDLVYSVLENFWPAIDHDELTITVGDEEISSKNLSEMLARFSGEEEFTAHLYYKAYKEASYSFQEELSKLKRVSLYLSTGDNDLPKRVAMVRKTGMVIFAKPFRSVIPYCGVFICRNEVGNKLLRDMEPPRHDVWDLDHPEKGANKPVEAEYLHFIRDRIKGLLPADDAKTITVPGLSRFLPDDDDSPEEAFEGTEEQKSESAERTLLPEKIEGKRMDPRRQAMQPDRRAAGEGEEETEGEGTDSPGNGGGGNGGGGTNGGGGGKRKGTSGGEQAKPTIPIRYRTFATDLAAGVYAVTIQLEQKSSKTADLSMWAVGDDQRAPIEIQSARQRDGKEIPVKGAGVLGPLVLPGNKGSMYIEVRLREALPLAMEVVAHEAE